MAAIRTTRIVTAPEMEIGDEMRILDALEKLSVIRRTAEDRRTEWERRFEGVCTQVAQWVSDHDFVKLSIDKAHRSLNVELDGVRLELTPKPNGMISVVHDGEEECAWTPEMSSKDVNRFVADFLEYALSRSPARDFA